MSASGYAIFSYYWGGAYSGYPLSGYPLGWVTFEPCLFWMSFTQRLELETVCVITDYSKDCYPLTVSGKTFQLLSPWSATSKASSRSKTLWCIFTEYIAHCKYFWCKFTIFCWVPSQNILQMYLEQLKDLVSHTFCNFFS